MNAIYIDAAWRETAWYELRGLALPIDQGAWIEDGNHTVGSSGNNNQTGKAVVFAVPSLLILPPLATLLARLPVVSLPDDLPRFSYFDAVNE